MKNISCCRQKTCKQSGNALIVQRYDLVSNPFQSVFSEQPQLTLFLFRNLASSILRESAAPKCLRWIARLVQSPLWRLMSGTSRLDLPDLFAQPGEVLRELDHHNDEGPSGEHARGPHQRVEDDSVVVEPSQENRLLPLAGIKVAGHLLVGLQTLGDVHDDAVHLAAVLLAPGHIETLPQNAPPRL